jgi:hypothetical protein
MRKYSHCFGTLKGKAEDFLSTTLKNISKNFKCFSTCNPIALSISANIASTSFTKSLKGIVVDISFRLFVNFLTIIVRIS